MCLHRAIKPNPRIKIARWGRFRRTALQTVMSACDVLIGIRTSVSTVAFASVRVRAIQAGLSKFLRQVVRRICRESVWWPTVKKYRGLLEREDRGKDRVDHNRHSVSHIGKRRDKGLLKLGMSDERRRNKSSTGQCAVGHLMELSGRHLRKS